MVSDVLRTEHFSGRRANAVIAFGYANIETAPFTASAAKSFR